MSPTILGRLNDHSTVIREAAGLKCGLNQSSLANPLLPFNDQNTFAIPLSEGLHHTGKANERLGATDQKFPHLVGMVEHKQLERSCSERDGISVVSLQGRVGTQHVGLHPGHRAHSKHPVPRTWGNPIRHLRSTSIPVDIRDG